MRDLKDFASFKTAFAAEANSYSGITGSTALDAGGDRLNAEFDFWAIRLVNGAYQWVRVAAYNNAITLF